ncbi:hypothetical protein GGI42DRAFT_288058 [Trichoderma sp. SZMC 28013]
MDGVHVISRLSLSLPVGGWGVNCQCVCVGAMRCCGAVRCCVVLCCVEVAFDVWSISSCAVLLLAYCQRKNMTCHSHIQKEMSETRSSSFSRFQMNNEVADTSPGFGNLTISRAHDE